MRYPFFLFGLFFLLISCSEEEENPNPLIGVWELDDVSSFSQDPAYSVYDVAKANTAFGERSYVFTFKPDFTFERELESLQVESGFADLQEEGDWESDGSQLDLDLDGVELLGLGYDFEIVEVDDRSLVLKYTEQSTLFDLTKLQEWFDDGLINDLGEFEVTEDEFDSLVANFTRSIDFDITLEFDKE